MRWIDAPDKDLKLFQKIFLNEILYKFKPHKSAIGFIKNKSVVDGAKKHIGKKVILTIDIKDFFWSIYTKDVNRLLRSKIFPALKNFYKNFSYKDDDIDIISNILTYKSRLPQGAPTSPMLANLICHDLDIILDNISKQNNCEYTRYADDLTFSHNSSNFDMNNFLNNVATVIETNNFTINYKKVRILRPHKRMMVTGIVVNNKLSTPKYIWKNIRAQLHQALKNNIILSLDEKQKLRGKIEWIGNLRPLLKEQFMNQFHKLL